MLEENIVYGPAIPTLEGPETIGEYFFEKLSAHGNKVAQVDSFTGRSHTFIEIASLSLKLAETMRYGVGSKKWHIGCGDSVGICSENTIEFCIPVMATIFLGAAIAPMNPSYTKREMEHCLKISKPKVVFTSPTRFKDVVEVARSTNSVQSVILIDQIEKDSYSNQGQNLSSDEDFVININSLIHPEDTFIPSLPLYKDFPKFNPKEQVALVMFSSGTTGLPKGVMLTHSNILTVLAQQLRRYVLPEDVVLGILPFFHAFGLMVSIINLAVGVKFVVMPHFDGDMFLNSIEKQKVSLLFIVPPIAVFIAKNPRVAKYDISSVRDIVCGAAPLGQDIQQEVQQVITKARAKIGAPPCRLRQGYGLTETTLGVTSAPVDTQKYGSIGNLAPGMQCKVVDLETKKTLGPNKRGELCFRGGLIMKGYLGDRQATSATIDNDGWLWTGDVGYYDDDGYFYIVDRIKELIKYKGFQVPPAELEAILLAHPHIEDVAVIGIPNEMAGELPLAVVVKKRGKKLTEAEIIKYVAARVSPQKRLHGGVRFVESIPKTATGKILRRVLRDTYKSKL